MQVTKLNNQPIHLVRRNVFGVARIYPGCAQSNMLATLSGTKTFALYQVDIMRALFKPLGVDIVISDSAE